MGVITLNNDVSCPVAPQKMFHAFCVDIHNIAPKVVPAVKSVDVHSGTPGSAGCIQQINLADASHGGKHVKVKLDTIDKANLMCKFTMTEFEGIAGNNVEFISFEIKFEASSNGGSIIKTKASYHLKSTATIKEADVKTGYDKFVGIFKLVESHVIQANA